MLRYSSPFLFLAGIPLLYYFAGPLWPPAVIAALLIALIGAEWLPPGGSRLASRPEADCACFRCSMFPCSSA